MQDILLNSTLKEKLSKKNTVYYVIEVEIKPGYSIQFFPEKADLEIIKMYYKVDNAHDSYLS